MGDDVYSFIFIYLVNIETSTQQASKQATVRLNESYTINTFIINSITHTRTNMYMYIHTYF